MSDSRNQISMIMAEEAKVQVIDLLKQITDLMPFLTGLTPEQRKRLPKIEKRNKSFVQDVAPSSPQPPQYQNSIFVFKHFNSSLSLPPPPPQLQ